MNVPEHRAYTSEALRRTEEGRSGADLIGVSSITGFEDAERVQTALEMLAEALASTGGDHTHEGLYYTQDELDAMLAGKSATGHLHDDSYKPLSYTPAWTEITGKPSSFSPSAHKSSHATGGADEITPADIGALSASHATESDPHPDYQKQAETDARYFREVQDHGAAETFREAINFTGAGVTVQDDGASGRVNVDIPGGGGSSVQVQDEDGTAFAARPTIRFVGEGVTATEDATNNRINVDVPGGGTGTATNASDTQKGVSRLSAAPADSSDPIAVATNDGRIPSTEENDALLGTSGAPSNTNRYVTDADPRNTNARPPTAHAHNAENIPYSGSAGLQSANVEAALDELDTEKQATSEKNQANGYAGLDSSGRVDTVRLGSGTRDATTVLFGDGEFKAAPSGGGGDFGTVVLLEYVATTDMGSPISTSSSGTNLGPSLDFTVGSSASIIEIIVSGNCVCSNNVECAGGVRVDGGTRRIFGGGFTAPNYLGGTGYLIYTGLSAGSHSAQVQIMSASAASAYCRASSVPHLEGFRVTILERKQ